MIREQVAKFLRDFLSFTGSKPHWFLVVKIKCVLKPWATVNEVEDGASVICIVWHAAVNYAIVHQISIATVG